MTPHFQRGQLLYVQERYKEAEGEFRKALVANPQDVRSLTMLSGCLAAQDRHDDAVSMAKRAVGLAPDEPGTHHAHALALLLANRAAEARSPIAEAIRLAPESDEYFAEQAAILLTCGDAKAALRSAEQAMALNPENTRAANLRAMALVRLGRKKEAADTVSYTLEREPENHLSHANQGWNALHLNNPRKAQEHFKEALRLHPDFEYARRGMLEALKARNPVYRGMLAYFLWMGRQSGRMQWAFVLGTLAAQRVLRVAAESVPGLGAVIWPLLILFYLFIYLSWVAVPMFNLLLRLDRFGRLVLSAGERRASNWFGAAFFGALGALAGFAFGWAPGLPLALVLAAASVCVAATFAMEGRPRKILAGASAVLFACGTGAWALFFFSEPPPDPSGCVASFMGGFIAFQFLAMILARRA